MSEERNCPFACLYGKDRLNAISNSDNHRLFFNGFDWEKDKRENERVDNNSCQVKSLVYEVLVERLDKMYRHNPGFTYEIENEILHLPSNIWDARSQIENLIGKDKDPLPDLEIKDQIFFTEEGEKFSLPCEGCVKSLIIFLNKVKRETGIVLMEPYIPPNTKIEVPEMEELSLEFIDKTGDYELKAGERAKGKVVVVFNEKSQKFEINFCVYPKPNNFDEKRDEIQHKNLIGNSAFGSLDAKDNRNLGGLNMEIDYKDKNLEIYIYGESKEFGALKKNPDLILNFLEKNLIQKFDKEGQKIIFMSGLKN